VKGVQADAAITDWLVPRALPLAGPGQNPGLTSFSRQPELETDMRSWRRGAQATPFGIPWLESAPMSEKRSTLYLDSLRIRPRLAHQLGPDSTGLHDPPWLPGP
jgi:hypothetical protein